MPAQTIRIDFVSDVSCPWCAIGLAALEQAVQRLDGAVTVDLHFQPFELNPQMVAEGEDVAEHLAKKYGSSAAQMRQNQEGIRQRGEAVGFTFNFDQRSRIYNTFDAHRLLHWAGLEGRQSELKHALLAAYFTDGEDVGSPAVLARVPARSGWMPTVPGRSWPATTMPKMCGRRSGSIPSAASSRCPRSSSTSAA
jgi:predicted DsbA family dithiol-disulfide isomerase